MKCRFLFQVPVPLFELRNRILYCSAVISAEEDDRVGGQDKEVISQYVEAGYAFIAPVLCPRPLVRCINTQTKNK